MRLRPVPRQARSSARQSNGGERAISSVKETSFLFSRGFNRCEDAPRYNASGCRTSGYGCRGTSGWKCVERDLTD
jgi:hypothetical protein